jgi:tricarballylate dehydrogenase
MNQESKLNASFDVIVVGAGNAALCAALAASEKGGTVIVLECAPEEQSGGNSRFTAGLFRIAYGGVEDLNKVIPDLTDEEIARTDFGAYTEEQFFDDMARVTEYRCDPDLTEVLVKRSLSTVEWMRSKGVRFTAAWGRQAFNVGGRFKFWGGLTVEAVGGGEGLVASLTNAARKNGVEIRYLSRVIGLLTDDSGVTGVRARVDGKTTELRSRAVILAAGGFQANPEMRVRYLGPGWELAKVRGTRFNTGEVIAMALAAGAAPTGNWSGCHAVAWERNAPDFGDLAVGDQFQKHSYPWGVYLNANGRRFVDEGADFRNYTYAKYGRVILGQPGQFAWQIFDAKVKVQLRDEYKIRQVTKVSANSLEDLVAKLDDVDQDAALDELKQYNRAVRQDIPFNPNVKDGRRTEGLLITKSNWANTLDTPPFEAYAVTCGITFTFGGLKINGQAEVVSIDGKVIPGLYAAGELVGGIFWFNYPGGSGLTNGAVFGRIAGANAGARAASLASPASAATRRPTETS